MKCVECGLRFEAPGGIGGQQIPRCPLCPIKAERDRLTAAIEARDAEHEVDMYKVNEALGVAWIALSSIDRAAELESRTEAQRVASAALVRIAKLVPHE